jgi:hypothetical protein
MRGIGDAAVGARDHAFAALQRQAQRIEHLRDELGELVEEEHAVMGERGFAALMRSPPPTIAAIDAE